MADNDRKEFLTDLPENYDAFQNENSYYFDHTTRTPEEWQQESYPISDAPLRQGLAIASMILGILSIILFCVFGFVLAIPGLILGVISLAQKRDGTGMAIAGVITSGLGFVLGICMLIIYIMSFKDLAGKDSPFADALNKNDFIVENDTPKASDPYAYDFDDGVYKAPSSEDTLPYEYYFYGDPNSLDEFDMFGDLDEFGFFDDFGMYDDLDQFGMFDDFGDFSNFGSIDGYDYYGDYPPSEGTDPNTVPDYGFGEIKEF